MGETKITFHWIKDKITFGSCVILRMDPSSTQHQPSSSSTRFDTQLLPPIAPKKLDGIETRYSMGGQMKRQQG